MAGRHTNIFSLILSRTHAAVAALAEQGRVPAGLDTSRIVVEPPRDAAHGDMATNAAMISGHRLPSLMMDQFASSTELI